MHAGERARHGPVGRHRQRGAGGRQDRGLGGGDRRGQHREDEQLATPGAEHQLAEVAQDVVEVLLGGDALDAAEGQCRSGHEHIGREQRERGQHRRLARGPARVGGLLVHRDRGVPAPVDEDRQDQAGRQLGATTSRWGPARTARGSPRSPARRCPRWPARGRPRRRGRARPSRCRAGRTACGRTARCPCSRSRSPRRGRSRRRTSPSTCPRRGRRPRRAGRSTSPRSAPARPSRARRRRRPPSRRASRPVGRSCATPT